MLTLQSHGFRSLTMTNRVIELLTFRLRAGRDAESFQEGIAASMEFLQRQHGFRGRRLGRTGNGSWADEIEWADMPAARAAAAAFLADATLAPFIAAIEPMSVRLEHYELRG